MVMSQYLRLMVLNWVKGTAFDAAPDPIYISLHTGDPGVLGANELPFADGYARKLVDNPGGFGTIAAPSGTPTSPAQVDSAVLIDFTASSAANWGLVDHFGVWKHATSTATNQFLWGGTADGKTIGPNDVYQFDIGNLFLSIH